MPDFIYDLPLAVNGTMLIVGLCLFAVSGLLLVRRFVLPRLRIHIDDSQFSGSLVQCVMVFYGLAVALIAVWIMDGGKYTINRGTGDIKGTWTDAGDNACFTEVDPAPPAGTKPFCPPGGARKVGDTWSLTQPDGKASQCILKEGNS